MKKWRQKPDARCQWKPLITQQLICHLSAEEGHNDQPLLGSKEIFFDRVKVVVRNKKATNSLSLCSCEIWMYLKNDTTKITYFRMGMKAISKCKKFYPFSLTWFPKVPWRKANFMKLQSWWSPRKNIWYKREHWY